MASYLMLNGKMYLDIFYVCLLYLLCTKFICCVSANTSICSETNQCENYKCRQENICVLNIDTDQLKSEIIAYDNITNSNIIFDPVGYSTDTYTNLDEFFLFYRVSYSYDQNCFNEVFGVDYEFANFKITYHDRSSTYIREKKTQRDLTDFLSYLTQHGYTIDYFIWSKIMYRTTSDCLGMARKIVMSIIFTCISRDRNNYELNGVKYLNMTDTTIFDDVLSYSIIYGEKTIYSHISAVPGSSDLISNEPLFEVQINKISKHTNNFDNNYIYYYDSNGNIPDIEELNNQYINTYELKTIPLDNLIDFDLMSEHIKVSKHLPANYHYKNSVQTKMYYKKFNGTEYAVFNDITYNGAVLLFQLPFYTHSTFLIDLNGTTYRFSGSLPTSRFNCSVTDGDEVINKVNTILKNNYPEITINIEHDLYICTHANGFKMSETADVELSVRFTNTYKVNQVFSTICTISEFEIIDNIIHYTGCDDDPFIIAKHYLTGKVFHITNNFNTSTIYAGRYDIVSYTPRIQFYVHNNNSIIIDDYVYLSTVNTDNLMTNLIAKFLGLFNIESMPESIFNFIDDYIYIIIFAVFVILIIILCIRVNVFKKSIAIHTKHCGCFRCCCKKQNRYMQEYSSIPNTDKFNEIIIKRTKNKVRK